jgi:hypothetical protein
MRNGEHLLAVALHELFIIKRSSSHHNVIVTMKPTLWCSSLTLLLPIRCLSLLPAILDLPASAFSSCNSSSHQIDCCVFDDMLSPPAPSSLRTLLSLNCFPQIFTMRKVRCREGWVFAQSLFFHSSFIKTHLSCYCYVTCNSHRGKWRGCFICRGHETHQKVPVKFYDWKGDMSERVSLFLSGVLWFLSGRRSQVQVAWHCGCGGWDGGWGCGGDFVRQQHRGNTTNKTWDEKHWHCGYEMQNTLISVFIHCRTENPWCSLVFWVFCSKY